MTDRIETIKIPNRNYTVDDVRWLIAEVTKLRAWHANNLELIGQQAEIIQRTNAAHAEMSREVGKQAELLRQAGIHLDEMERQSYGQGQ